MPARATIRHIEERTQQLGHELFERMRGLRPMLWQGEYWQDWLLKQCTHNEWFKVQTFRLIDALPMLGDDVELARHLREYFVLPQVTAARGRRPTHGADDDDGGALRELEPATTRWLVRWVSYWMNFRRPDSWFARRAARFARGMALRMARNFIPGTNLDEAQRAFRKLRERRLASTIDVLGEAALSRSEAEAYHRTYLDLIRELPRRVAAWPEVPLIDTADGQPLPRVNISVKLTSICPGLDPIAPQSAKALAKDMLRPLMRQALQSNVHLHLDMEHYAIKDLTLELWEELLLEPEFRDYPHFGTVLQAYLKDGDQDAARTIEFARRRGTPFWVRLVKGAYWDSETVWADQAHWPWPVWEQKWQSDACFERMTEALLTNHQYLCTAFASHNIRSLAHALAWREALQLPAAAFELQMLYGMGDPIKRAAVEMGQRCRVYTPYGPLLAGMAYFIRRLLENTANESFLRHAADAPESELLRHPQAVGRHAPPFEKPPAPRYEFEEHLMDAFENVPNSDFVHESHRRRMLTGLAQVRADMGGEVPLVIGGEPHVTGAWFQSLNPSRPREIVARVAQADADAADRAVQAASRAFASQRNTPPHERAALLERVAQRMEQQRATLAAWAVLECGQPWREADADVSTAIDYCNYYARELLRVAENIREREIPGQTNEYFYAPRGVVAVISPWSSPLAVPMGMIAAALVTGNTVVFKPARAASACGARLVELFAAEDLPPGALNFVPGPGATVGEHLVRHPDVAAVAFTGSRDVGLRVNRLAAEVLTSRPGLKKVIPQFGGKNAIIVDADADLDEALKGVVASAFAYAGQKCSAAARVIVLDAIHDRFVERLVETVRSVRVGPADEPTTSIPPVIDQAACDAIRRYLALGRQEARCVLAVDAAAPLSEFGGYYVGPAIFDDVPPTARIAREDICGPVLCVLRARDMRQAIELFNHSDYALTGGLYSRSPANIDLARRHCECGNFYINCPITSARVDLQPFGGGRLSGLAVKSGGPDYLIHFCEPRTVTENTIRRGFAPSEEALQALR